jgi:hypothetical protein
MAADAAIDELSKEVGKLRQKGRLAEATLSKASSSRARRTPSGYVPQH